MREYILSGLKMWSIDEAKKKSLLADQEAYLKLRTSRNFSELFLENKVNRLNHKEFKK